MKKPKNKIRGYTVAALRRIWTWTPEYREARKRDEYKCIKCGSTDKTNLHHTSGKINWEKIMKLLYKELYVSADNLKTLCKKCHKEEHDV
jgi:5-methylcytosine-specific restriction endonuclease McrA